ncbi:MotA/TolQ/ExbB proton channel family protein [Nocardioides sp. TRM66260-LWL]|uniref:MotA/TolQ/ExbB proton channel family protein n=1 Tax=Nocardioides sp. TRM66260-LWL TaxID=2874478 RepID=UPI001CC6D82D|nr:MotA/TolQ/ExbB proton channel family protein [Nocardioides sp. TRM66260-LWL]MBZ5733417.1 MotA/TolQ/ExbB proton channel family protein [Nocardioides sp. TRM66260-LWL]
MSAAMDGVYGFVYDLADALEGPVVVLAVVALLVTVVEAGAFLVELWQRRPRAVSVAGRAVAARTALDAGDREAALDELRPLGRTARMRVALETFAAVAGPAAAEPVLAKELADVDLDAQRRLGRTRLLVRFGPALGLMGTLIPLAPALEGLASGDVTTLSQNLRTAFSVTVLGLLVGAVAFAVSLVRERLYGQDWSDLEFVAAVLTADDAPPLPPHAVEPEPEPEPESEPESDDEAEAEVAR